jgi:hypothetical protein
MLRNAAQDPLHRRPTPQLMPRLYHVQLTTGPIELYAVTQAQAIASALELAGPGARVLRVWREGEW